MTNNDNSNHADQIKKKFLFLLLEQIEQYGDSRTTICQNIKKSNQSLQYHLNRLLETQLIKKVQSYPFAHYILTDLGKQIKETLAHNGQARAYWRIHALSLGFPIDNYGTFKFDNRKKSLPNFDFQDEKITDSYGVWNVRVQSSGLMIINCPEKITADPKALIGGIYETVTKLAMKYSEAYKMDIGRMRIIREAHKELIGSEKLAGLLGKVRIPELLHVDDSTGENRLEEKQSSDAIEELLTLPQRIDQLTDVLDGLKKHWETHLPLMESMAKTQIEQRETMAQMRDIMAKIEKSVNSKSKSDLDD